MERAGQVFPFADRVAAVRRDGRFEGYLLVTVPAMRPSPHPITYVDMALVRPDAEESSGWRYEDRADPGVEDAWAELSAAVLDWYGERLDVHWLDGAEAERVRAIFG
ncbi:hypothetical protein [Saccharothrix sp. Mg75]|uniref:hypothetical protein n=1 Tax=Saccharothrix sp. Mg75 TaxID=3445357 RepID=UPI003EECE8C9